MYNNYYHFIRVFSKIYNIEARVSLTTVGGGCSISKLWGDKRCHLNWSVSSLPSKNLSNKSKQQRIENKLM